MDPLVRYYLHQSGRGAGKGIGPIYALSPFHQRGYGFGSFLICGGWSDPFFGEVRRPWDERLRTGGKILTEIAENDSPDVRPRDIVSKHARDLTL